MPPGIPQKEQAAFGGAGAAFRRGYLTEQGEHPQTIGYALTDSPVGLAAWMLDHDADSYQKISHALCRRTARRRPHTGLLDSSVAAVNSALQRARLTLEARLPGSPPRIARPGERSATRPPRSLRPGFVPAWAASVAVVFNAVNIVSTMIWQGRLHGALAATGYDEKRVSLLIRTNWIRTAALLTQAVIALYCVYRGVSVAA